MNSNTLYRYNNKPDGTLRIIQYLGSEENLTLPVELDNIKVTAVHDFAFKGNTALRNLVIPDGITDIGVEAFSYCEHLTTVTVLGDLDFIGIKAFFGCSSLELIRANSAKRVSKQIVSRVSNVKLICDLSGWHTYPESVNPIIHFVNSYYSFADIDKELLSKNVEYIKSRMLKFGLAVKAREIPTLARFLCDFSLVGLEDAEMYLETINDAEANLAILSFIEKNRKEKNDIYSMYEL